MSMRRLLAIRDTRIYLIGQAFSLLGDSALWLAMGIWVKTMTGSNGAAGLVFFFFTAPTLLAPVSGLIVDRVRRRPLLMATNACTGGVVLLLLLVHGPGQIWLVYLVMALYGLAYTLLGSGQSALLTVLVPGDLLPDANGALRTVQEALRLIAPLAGAGLFILVGAHVVAIMDAATFGVPVLCLALLRLREPRPRPSGERWRAEVLAGFRYLAATPVLRQLVIAGACMLTVFGFSETIVFAIVGQGLHRPPAFVGILIAVQGAGAVLGGPTAAPLIRRIGESWLVGVAMLVAAIGAALCIPPLLPVVITGVVLLGMAIPWLVVGFMTLLQRRTPAELQGRAYAAADALVTTPQTISIALGAALIGVAGYRTLLVVMAVVTVGAAGYLLSRPEQRRGAVTEPARVKSPPGQRSSAPGNPRAAR
jgi:MFS family permease